MVPVCLVMLAWLATETNVSGKEEMYTDVDSDEIMWLYDGSLVR